MRNAKQEDEAAQQADRHGHQIGGELEGKRMGPVDSDQSEQDHSGALAYPDAIDRDGQRHYHREQWHEKQEVLERQMDAERPRHQRVHADARELGHDRHQEDLDEQPGLAAKASQPARQIPQGQADALKAHRIEPAAQRRHDRRVKRREDQTHAQQEESHEREIDDRQVVARHGRQRGDEGQAREGERAHHAVHQHGGHRSALRALPMARGVGDARDVAADIGGQEIVEEETDVVVGARLPEGDVNLHHVQQAAPLIGAEQVAGEHQQPRGDEPHGIGTPQRGGELIEADPPEQHRHEPDAEQDLGADQSEMPTAEATHPASGAGSPWTSALSDRAWESGQRNRLAHSIPALARRSRSALSLSTRASTAAKRGSSRGGNSSPVTPSRTESRRPGLSAATTAVPQAPASITVSPQPSLGDGCTCTQASWSARTLSAGGTKPRNSTASANPSRMAIRWSVSPKGPSPSTIRRAFGTRARTPGMARITRSSPL